MGKTVLTPNQRKLLEALCKDSYIIRQFFLTGGSALSEFYFQHRFSEDLDLFSEKKFDSKKVLAWVSEVSKRLKVSKVQQQSLTGQNVFFFYFGKKFVKVDFSYFPFPHFGTFKKFHELNISSVEDICINKVHAITTRKRSRDYLDLYFCLKHLSWTPRDLQKQYKLKFDVHLSPEQVATSFTNVIDAQDLPIFLGKIPRENIENYFLDLAKKLKKEILK